MADHYYTQGDDGPILEDRLQTPSGEDFDLTGCSVQFRAELADDAAVTVSAAGEVSEEEADEKRPFAQLIPSETLFTRRGAWLYRWRVTAPDGGVYSFPNAPAWWSVYVSAGPNP